MSTWATDARVSNRKFSRVYTSKRLARIYTIRTLQFTRGSPFFFFLFFLHVRSHAYVSERAFRPDHRKFDTIRISVGAYVVEIGRVLSRRGNDISCCIRLNCKTIGGEEEIRADYRRLLSAACRSLIARGRMDRNRRGL